MRKYRIIIDATADLPIQWQEKWNITVLPMQYMLGEVPYTWGAKENVQSSAEFYVGMLAGKKAMTAQINEYQYITALTPYLRAGEDVLLLTFSSGMSGTYLAAVRAAEHLTIQYPGCNIYVLDTKAASGGEAMLALQAAEKKEAGWSLHETAQWLEHNKRYMKHWFVVDDLIYLQRSGRLSVSNALTGNLLDIKPVLKVDLQGKLVLDRKVRGSKPALKVLFQMMQVLSTADQPQTVLICHAAAPEKADYLKRTIESVYPDAKVVIGEIGPVIGSHVGPGCVALFFWEVI